MTNKTSTTSNTRNIVALADLGEGRHVGNTIWGGQGDVAPSNNANNEYYAMTHDYAAARDIDTHLYSSAFVVDRHFANEGDAVPSAFTIIGAGWGHGVGLCQIGAAVMGAKGYPYNQILLHYYRGAEIKKYYI